MDESVLCRGRESRGLYPHTGKAYAHETHTKRTYRSVVLRNRCSSCACCPSRAKRSSTWVKTRRSLPRWHAKSVHVGSILFRGRLFFHGWTRTQPDRQTAPRPAAPASSHTHRSTVGAWRQGMRAKTNSGGDRRQEERGPSAPPSAAPLSHPLPSISSAQASAVASVWAGVRGKAAAATWRWMCLSRRAVGMGPFGLLVRLCIWASLDVPPSLPPPLACVFFPNTRIGVSLTHTHRASWSKSTTRANNPWGVDRHWAMRRASLYSARRRAAKPSYTCVRL